MGILVGDIKLNYYAMLKAQGAHLQRVSVIGEEELSPVGNLDVVLTKKVDNVGRTVGQGSDGSRGEECGELLVEREDLSVDREDDADVRIGEHFGNLGGEEKNQGEFKVTSSAFRAHLSGPAPTLIQTGSLEA